MNNKYFLSFDAFVRSFKQNKDTACAFLLGAGASISSGIQSANDCIWDWKKDIFTSSNPNSSEFFQNIKSDSVKAKIQEWLDRQQSYPALNSPEEYSFYAERAYPIEEDRRKYFLNLCYDKEPYIGYKLLCLLGKYNIVQSVWTTNFDGLVERAAHQINITPISINLDNAQRIYRTQNKKELLYISLHGDYKYSQLKNTTTELDSQESTFIDILKHYFVDKNLVVIGYSGRDHSLMSALKQAFTQHGAGRLYWCGHGNTIPKEVESLITYIQSIGREAYYISTDGFDNTLITLANNCFANDYKKQKEIKDLLKTYPIENHTTPFTIKTGNESTYLKSNLFPVVLPKEVYQFSIRYERRDIGHWKAIRKRTKGKPIMAVPYKNKVYALSTITIINDTFGDCLEEDIVRVPIPISEIEKNGTFKELFLSSILYGIIQKRDLESNLRTKIWERVPFAQKRHISLHRAIECNLLIKEDENKYALLSIKPTLFLSSTEQITTSDKLLCHKEYIDKLRNKQYDEEIVYWQNILFGGHALRFQIPLDSGSDLGFAIGQNRALCSINVTNQQSMGYLPKNFDQRAVLYNGIQYFEPSLEFINSNGAIINDTHPMRGLTYYKPYDSLFNEKVFLNYVKTGVLCPRKYSNKFFSFLQLINQTILIGDNDYVFDYQGFEKTFNISIDIPNVESEKWITIDENYTCPIDLARTITQSIENLSNNYPGVVVIIFIPAIWQKYRQFSYQNEHFDLHDYIKAYAAQRNIATQIIEEKTIENPMKCEICWWLSLAFYVKSMRTPWALSNLEKDTAYAGIGYSVKRDKKGQSQIVLGCSHIYNEKGQGLKYKLSQINNPFFDDKHNPFLSYDEAFKLGISIRELFMQSMDTLPKRVVVHKRTAFKEDEINGLKDALGKAGIENIDLIEINFDYNMRFLAQKILNGTMSTDGFPLSRGTCILVSQNTALLWTHGIVPSIRNQNYKYYQGGRSIPSPLRIVKHYGKGDLNTICTEILGFTKMNWNSFNLYTKLPATIDTSNTLARVGNMLSMYEGRTYDYRYFI